MEKVWFVCRSRAYESCRDNLVKCLLVMVGKPMLLNHSRVNGSNRAIVVKIKCRACVSRNDVRSERNNADICLKIN